MTGHADIQRVQAGEGGRRGVTRALSVAPMMDRTDRHFRWFLRRITRHTLLYTEMVTAQAILNGDRDYLLGFSPEEGPLALQLGGDDPRALAECARIAQDFGYDEVNLNVGCPSDRVQSGRFGACLMARPEYVADCVAEMRAATDLPVTVKHRIGIDDLDRYEDMLRFVDVVAAAGCDRFTVHARKAWLNGLSPKENREIPPLRHAEVHRLKRERPELVVETNGGILTLAQAREHLVHVDAVMIGRAAWDDPYLFATADAELFGDPRPVPTRLEVAQAMLPYVADWTARGLKLITVARPMLTLFNGQPGARAFRRHLSEHAGATSTAASILEQALRAPEPA